VPLDHVRPSRLSAHSDDLAADGAPGLLARSTLRIYNTIHFSWVTGIFFYNTTAPILSMSCDNHICTTGVSRIPYLRVCAGFTTLAGLNRDFIASSIVIICSTIGPDIKRDSQDQKSPEI